MRYNAFVQEKHARRGYTKTLCEFQNLFFASVALLLSTLFDAIPDAGGPSFALVPCSSSDSASLGRGDG